MPKKQNLFAYLIFFYYLCALFHRICASEGEELVGINYNKKTKVHECSIESVSVDEHQNEHQRKVADLVDKNPSISLDSMVEIVGVSKITIRRDLQKLGYTWIGASKTGHWERTILKRNGE